MTTPGSAAHIAGQWLDRFEHALRSGDAGAVAELFAPDCWWRDILCLSWDFRTFDAETMPDAVSLALRSGLRGFALSTELAPDDSEHEVFALITFQSDQGPGAGSVRLRSVDGQWKAAIVLTTLQGLHGREEAVGAQRPRFARGSDHRGSLPAKEESWRSPGGDPEVLIVGGGHAGLIIAARLAHLGVAAVVIERNHRVGDNWRKRYQSLVLHDTVWNDQLPYLPYPSSWPIYAPKDKMGDWLETYATALDLDVWTSSTVLSARRNDADTGWVVQVQLPDGTVRELAPRHLVIATGVSGGAPSSPPVPSADRFSGRILHSSQYDQGEAFRDASVLVVGAGSSGHDIAQDLHGHGARVTLLQRSDTFVIGLRTLNDVMMGNYQEHSPRTELADLIAASVPTRAALDAARERTRLTMQLDGELLDGLRRAGFGVSTGVDDTGTLLLAFQRSGGYYINVGCSDLIAAGQIRVKRGGLPALDGRTVTFDDGSSEQVDVIILATGYRGILESARGILGDEIVDRCGPVWGLDDEGEVRNMWRVTGQPGLWFMGGNLSLARPNSRFLALRITAELEGLVESPAVAVPAGQQRAH